MSRGGGRALVTIHPGEPRLVELVDDGLDDEPDFPLIVAALLDITLGTETLSAVTAVGRSPAASRIAPRALPVADTAASPVAPSGLIVDLSTWLIVAALLVLVGDWYGLSRRGSARGGSQ